MTMEITLTIASQLDHILILLTINMEHQPIERSDHLYDLDNIEASGYVPTEFNKGNFLPTYFPTSYQIVLLACHRCW